MIINRIRHFNNYFELSMEKRTGDGVVSEYHGPVVYAAPVIISDFGFASAEFTGDSHGIRIDFSTNRLIFDYSNVPYQEHGRTELIKKETVIAVTSAEQLDGDERFAAMALAIPVTIIHLPYFRAYFASPLIEYPHGTAMGSYPGRALNAASSWAPYFYDGTHGATHVKKRDPDTGAIENIRFIQVPSEENIPNRRFLYGSWQLPGVSLFYSRPANDRDGNPRGMTKNLMGDICLLKNKGLRLAPHQVCQAARHRLADTARARFITLEERLAINNFNPELNWEPNGDYSAWTASGGAAWAAAGHSARLYNLPGNDGGRSTAWRGEHRYPGGGGDEVLIEIDCAAAAAEDFYPTGEEMEFFLSPYVFADGSYYFQAAIYRNAEHPETVDCVKYENNAARLYYLRKGTEDMPSGFDTAAIEADGHFPVLPAVEADRRDAVAEFDRTVYVYSPPGKTAAPGAVDGDIFTADTFANVIPLLNAPLLDRPRVTEPVCAHNFLRNLTPTIKKVTTIKNLTSIEQTQTSLYSFDQRTGYLNDEGMIYLHMSSGGVSRLAVDLPLSHLKDDDALNYLQFTGAVVETEPGSSGRYPGSPIAVGYSRWGYPGEEEESYYLSGVVYEDELEAGKTRVYGKMLLATGEGLDASDPAQIHQGCLLNVETLDATLRRRAWHHGAGGSANPPSWSDVQPEEYVYTVGASDTAVAANIYPERRFSHARGAAVNITYTKGVGFMFYAQINIEADFSITGSYNFDEESGTIAGEPFSGSFEELLNEMKDRVTSRSYRLIYYNMSDERFDVGGGTNGDLPCGVSVIEELFSPGAASERYTRDTPQVAPPLPMVTVTRPGEPNWDGTSDDVQDTSWDAQLYEKISFSGGVDLTTFEVEWPDGAVETINKFQMGADTATANKKD